MKLAAFEGVDLVACQRSPQRMWPLNWDVAKHELQQMTARHASLNVLCKEEPSPLKAFLSGFQTSSNWL